MLILALLPMVSALPAAPKGAAKEPFTSFRIIDQQLSKLDARATSLKTQPADSLHFRDLRDMRAAIGVIHTRVARLVGIYKARGDRFGVKMFSAIATDADAVARALSKTQVAKTRVERKLAADRFSAAMLKLVLRYQAVSSNYGANHCSARQWSCCEPKNDPETNRGPAAACKWTCVPKRSSCSGFLGPQTLK
jgi:hypothetical protein